MTSWSPGGGVPDVLSHGGDAPRWRRGQVVAAAVALLVSGAAAGAGVIAGLSDRLPWLQPTSEPPALVAGAVVVADTTSDRHRYRLDLFNPGPGLVQDVTVVGFVGRAVTVARNEAVDLLPRAWRRVYFSLPDECASPADNLSRSVLVHQGTRAGEAGGEQEVALAEPAAALRENHERECVGVTALSARDLSGLWVLEDVEGTWTDLAKVGLMRFTSDGRFAFDPEGHIFRDGHQGWFGTAGLHGRRLVLRGEGGYACPAGYTEWWATTRLTPQELVLENIQSDEGYCHTPPGERWTLRRLVPETRLPPAPERSRQ